MQRKGELQVSSVVRGHHASKSFWMPAINEILTVISEDSNPHDRFAVVLSARRVGVVGHVPHVQVPEFHYRELVLP